MSGRMAHRAVVAALLLAALAMTGCDAGTAGATGGRLTLRLGYFPNLTHATPIVGLARGFYTQRLGPGVGLETRTFNAGPEAVQALFSGAIDAVYIGPNPTVTAFAQSRGKAVRVVAGAASGGAALVVKPSIARPEDLRGRRIATPQLGNTQDVALRYWLREHGLTATIEGGGDVHVLPQDNSSTVTAFVSGGVDGAWVPQPYAARLVAAGGRVLVDERDLWPGGRFVVTNLVVGARFLAAHRGAVKSLLAAHVAANAFINADPAQAQRIVNESLGALTGKPLDPALTAAAWPTLTFLNDPLAGTLRTGARHATEVGLLKETSLDGLYDLAPLNEVLAAAGSPAVTS